jgi:hypothetical protein
MTILGATEVVGFDVQFPWKVTGLNVGEMLAGNYQES